MIKRVPAFALAIVALVMGAVVIGIVAASPVVADSASSTWTVVPAPTDGPPFPAASAVSDDGYRLYVWSREDERGHQVFAELHAADGARFIGRMPTWRVDAGPVVDTDEIRQAGEAQDMLWGFTADAVSIWMLWLGAPDVPADDPLHGWFEGETLVVSIRMANGEDRTILFALAGAAAAIEEAGEIRPVRTTAEN